MQKNNSGTTFAIGAILGVVIGVIMVLKYLPNLVSNVESNSATDGTAWKSRANEIISKMRENDMVTGESASSENGARTERN